MSNKPYRQERCEACGLWLVRLDRRTGDVIDRGVNTNKVKSARPFARRLMGRMFNVENLVRIALPGPDAEPATALLVSCRCGRKQLVPLRSDADDVLRKAAEAATDVALASKGAEAFKAEWLEVLPGVPAFGAKYRTFVHSRRELTVILDLARRHSP